MAEKYVPLEIPPGFYQNGTNYQASRRWTRGNLVRFTNRTIQPVGGWRRLQDDTGGDLAPIAGIARNAAAWRASGAALLTAIATTEKLYVLAAGALRDITPVGFVTGRADTGYATASGAYGSGVYGNGLYGVGSTAAALTEADTWQLDTFGDWLAAVCTSDKKLYVWQGNYAVLPTVPAGAPAVVSGVVVTPERFLVALGAGGNARKVQWPSQETSTDWVPSSVNTAGDYELTTNGRLVAGRRTKSQTLLWTDDDLHSMTYIGGLLVYRFDQVARDCGLLAPNAVATVDTQAYWMGRNSFFMYDGYVKELPSEVQDYVFGDFNTLQSAKVFAVQNPQFGEVWWFYPSAGSTEIDRYVVYSYREGHWVTGNLPRTAGVATGVLQYPIMVDANGILYEHEILAARSHSTVEASLADGTVVSDGGSFADGSFLDFTVETPYLESGPMEIGEGDRMVSVNEIVPDEFTAGEVAMRLYTAMYPNGPETIHGPFAANLPTSVRITGRQVRIRLEEEARTPWRVGTYRLGVVPGGRR